MAKRGGNMVASDMYCTKCGKQNIPIARKGSKQREKGHHKKMYCIHCQKEYNMVEIKYFGDKEQFLEDYATGKFLAEVQEIERMRGEI